MCLAAINYIRLQDSTGQTPTFFITRTCLLKQDSHFLKEVNSMSGIGNMLDTIFWVEGKTSYSIKYSEAFKQKSRNNISSALRT